MKRKNFKSYPGGAGLAGNTPSHLMPIVAVDADWTLVHGNRSQRRRIEKALILQTRQSGGAK